MAPFGLPVVPDVYSQKPGLAAVVGAGGTSVESSQAVGSRPSAVTTETVIGARDRSSVSESSPA